MLKMNLVFHMVLLKVFSSQLVQILPFGGRVRSKSREVGKLLLWFGSFRRYPKGWIFHADLNWLYAYAGESGDVQLWSHDHGWLTDNEGVYPHLFNHSVAIWFYFIKKQDRNPKFYDYTSESVK